jgi:hypothetical protein
MTYTLEDYLLTLHIGDGWFGWSDSSNKVYANLILQDKISNGVNENNAPLLKDNPHSKPSESACTAGVAALQATYDNAAYKRTRAAAYPELKEQLDLLYKDMLADKGDKTGTWFAAVKAVKDATAKPE